MSAPLPPVLWKKRVLVPFWIIRICLMIFIIAAYGLTLRTLSDIKDVIKPAIATVVIFMLMIIIVLLIDVLAIVLFLRDALKPGTFLTMNCIQTGFWAGVLIMDIVAIGRGASAVGIGFSVFVFVTFAGLFVYSLINYRRAKKAAQLGQYAPAHNPAAPAPPGYHAQYHNAPSYQQNTAYAPPNGAHDLQNQYTPPYQGSAGADYYHQQPTKAAQIV